MENQLDAQKMLDLYIHDYLQRNNMQAIADIFAEEAGLIPTGVSAALPEGFLTDWWSFFWQMYCSRTNQSPTITGEFSSQAAFVVEPNLNLAAGVSSPYLMNAPQIHELTLAPRTHQLQPSPDNQWLYTIPEDGLSFMPENHQVPLNSFLPENVTGGALRGSALSNVLQPFQAINTVQDNYSPHWNATYDFGYGQPSTSTGEALHHGSRSSWAQPDQFSAPSEFFQQGGAAQSGGLLPSSSGVPEVPFIGLTQDQDLQVEQNAEFDMSKDVDFQSFFDRELS